MDHHPLFNTPFLASRWEKEYQDFRGSGNADALVERLRRWSARDPLKETASEAAFIKLFYRQTWDYAQQGDRPDGAYQCHPQFSIARAGGRGAPGPRIWRCVSFGDALNLLT